MDEAIVLCRFLHFTAALFLFGVSVFQWKLAPPALAPTLARLLRPLAGIAVLVILVTTVAWLLLTAGTLGEVWSDSFDPGTISAVLFSTAFGQVWQWRLGFAVLLLGLMVIGHLGN